MNTPIDLRGFKRGGATAEQGASSTGVRPPRRVVSRYIVPGALLAGAAALFAGSAGELLERPVSVRVVMPIQMQAATTASAAPLFQAPGWLEPDPYPVHVSGLTPGIVYEVYVLEGEHIEKGALLAELVDEDARLLVEQAHALVARKQADYDTARANWTNPTALQEAVRSAEAKKARLEAEHAGAVSTLEIRRKEATIDQSLSRSGSSTRLGAEKLVYDARVAEAQVASLAAEIREVDATLAAARERLQLRIHDRGRLAVTEAEMREAQLELKQAELRLNRCRVKAPRSGTIMRLKVAPGSMLSPETHDGMQVATLYDPQRLQVRTDVPLADAAKVREGMRAELRFEALPGHAFSGQISRIVHEADVQRNTIQVKVQLLDPDPALKPEMIARVQFLAEQAPESEPDQRESLFIPASLMPTDTSEHELWVATSRMRAEKRKIMLGGMNGDLREVRGGLWPSDKIIVSGTDQLQPGTPIKLQEAD
jgi:HlyD family secretion protein